MTQAYALPDGNVAIAFSGGRTSAYMLHQIIEANGIDAVNSERVVVSFQNTGREMPETLDFVQECAERWGVKIVWLEYRDHERRYEVVSHKTASRKGEPFEALIKRYQFLPSQRFRLCSSEMKRDTLTRYLKTRGWKRWALCRGLRADEAQRLNGKPKGPYQFWHPLAEAGVTARDISAFWKMQDFNLELPDINGRTQLGNCDGCFLKSEAHRAAFLRDFPERAQWWLNMERWALSNAKHPDRAAFIEGQPYAELQDFVQRQGDWIFDAEGALCQASDGECTP